MADIRHFPLPKPDTRKSSEIRAAWGVPPPKKIDRVPFEFWDGTSIPGGVHPLIVEAVRRMDRVFRDHSYELGTYTAGDDWCYSRRRIKGTNRWSMHSWAIALDINATTNPWSKRFVTDLTPQIVADVQAISHMGRSVWAWGGHWGRNGKSRYDSMHWQINLTPAEAQAMRPEETIPVVPNSLEFGARLDRIESHLRNSAGMRETVNAFVRGADPKQIVGYLWHDVTGDWPSKDEYEEYVMALWQGRSVPAVYTAIRAAHETRQRKVLDGG